jgi:hypothetical protein
MMMQVQKEEGECMVERVRAEENNGNGGRGGRRGRGRSELGCARAEV